MNCEQNYGQILEAAHKDAESGKLNKRGKKELTPEQLEAKAYRRALHDINFEFLDQLGRNNPVALTLFVESLGGNVNVIITDPSEINHSAHEPRGRRRCEIRLVEQPDERVKGTKAREIAAMLLGRKA